MKLSPNLTGRGAVVDRSLVAEEALAVVVAEDEMTIVATRVSRASLAGNNSGDEIFAHAIAVFNRDQKLGVYVCLEDERHLTSARKSKQDNRHSATRPNARTSGSRKSQRVKSAKWTKCAKCANSLKLRLRYSTLEQRSRFLRDWPGSIRQISDESKMWSVSRFLAVHCQAAENQIELADKADEASCLGYFAGTRAAFVK